MRGREKEEEEERRRNGKKKKAHSEGAPTDDGQTLRNNVHIKLL